MGVHQGAEGDSRRVEQERLPEGQVGSPCAADDTTVADGFVCG